MNKYKVITRESKKIRNEEIKNQITMIRPKNILNHFNMFGKLQTTLKNACVLSAYQLILNKDIYKMDEERLNGVLKKMKIELQHFYNQINIYNSYAYLIINRYIEYLEAINSADIDTKIRESYSCLDDFSNYAKMSKKHLNATEFEFISEERLSKIDDLVETIYQSNIKDKITSNKIKDSDIIKSAYNRKK